MILKHSDISQSIIVLLDLFLDSAQECGTVVLRVFEFSLTTNLRLLYMNVKIVMSTPTLINQLLAYVLFVINKFYRCDFHSIQLSKWDAGGCCLSTSYRYIPGYKNFYYCLIYFVTFEIIINFIYIYIIIAGDKRSPQC